MRSVAKDFAENERVLINGRIAKPSAEVKKGDILTLQIGERQTVYEVLDIKDNIKAADAKNLYRVVE
jgi:ribosomal 50S subunit-recycling heat shock protein